MIGQKVTNGVILARMLTDENILEDDREFLLRRAKEMNIPQPERAETFVFEIVNGTPAYLAAERAGYSCGKTTDPRRKRKI